MGKAGACPSKAPFRCSTLGRAPGLTHKHLTILERLAMDKHSSLLQKVVNYDRKKFYMVGSWVVLELNCDKSLISFSIHGSLVDKGLELGYNAMKSLES